VIDAKAGMLPGREKDKKGWRNRRRFGERTEKET
jgi:hypothetical protein